MIIGHLRLECRALVRGEAKLRHVAWRVTSGLIVAKLGCEKGLIMEKLNYFYHNFTKYVTIIVSYSLSFPVSIVLLSGDLFLFSIFINR